LEQVNALADGTRILVGVTDRPLPRQADRVLAALSLTLAPDGPGHCWIRPAEGDPQLDLDAITAMVHRSPFAALALESVLRVTASRSLAVAQAVAVESCAYSMLLASAEFAAWRKATAGRGMHTVDEPVIVDREGGELHVTLNDPATRNALSVSMRDGLCDALSIAEWDRSVQHIVLRGNGPSFCSGGHLDEFGTAPDVARAHITRLRQHVGLAVHRLSSRTTAELHGSCVGSGIEIPAFAGRTRASADAKFWLPELEFGLIPGSGGTVSITRRVGRWRTAYLALTGHHLSVESAIEWGLVDGPL